MKPMTAAEFGRRYVEHGNRVLSGSGVHRIVEALKEREELLKAHKLLMAGVSQEPPNHPQFVIGFASAIGWAQGLFWKVQRRPSTGQDVQGGKPGTTDVCSDAG